MTLLRAHFGTAVRVSAALFAVQVAVTVYEAPRTPGIFEPLFWPDGDVGDADVPDWFWAVSLCSALITSAWIGAAWFRTVLGGAPARVAVPLRAWGGAVLHYVLLFLVMMAVTAPVGVLLSFDTDIMRAPPNLLEEAGPEQWRVFAKIGLYHFLVKWTANVVTLGLGLVFVARSLGDRLSYVQSVYRLEGAWWQVLSVAGALSAFYLLTFAPVLLDLSLWPALIWHSLHDWLVTLLIFAVLATLYARQIEGRALV
ncbi:MAG: hypothetical protein AAGF60_15115 [Pseudomonadota bacterium]